MPDKIAHQPLLAPGRHRMSISKLKDIGVAAFPASRRRSILFADLERLAGDSISAEVCCELWVDGSFLIEKLEPDDIDLSVVLFADDFEKLPGDIQTRMWTLLRGGKAYSPYLHTFPIFKFLKDDPRSAADNTDYWSKIWGKGWDDWLTGYAVLRFGESDVGLQLYA